MPQITGARRLAVVVAVLAAALLAAGAALACNGTSGTNASFSTFGHHHHRGFGGGVLATTAAYLGIDQATLKADLASGKTIADVAPAGKTAAGLAAAFEAQAKTFLDAKVTAGRLSATDEATLLAKIDAKLTTFANSLWTASFAGHEKVAAGMGFSAGFHTFGHHWHDDHDG